MIKTVILNKMTRKPVGTELVITPSRLSILGLITTSANNSGIHNGVHMMIDCQTLRSRFTRQVMRLKAQVPHLPRTLVSGSCRTFQMERRSQVAIRTKISMHRFLVNSLRRYQKKKALISITVMTLVLGLISYSKYTFITVHKNY